jgi:lipopolysaccharide/colanic/teichoic acid biosynthesis glycosyltransferase
MKESNFMRSIDPYINSRFVGLEPCNRERLIGLSQRTGVVYQQYGKRAADVLVSLVALCAFWWLYLVVAALVWLHLGSPVLFKQLRPGKIDPETGRERIFCLYKFRSMSEKRDESGALLPDEQRLDQFGRLLRATSLDELPEVFNILRGDMSIIGPRPQLVRDMVFMTAEQRRRHIVKPGLSGLAQIHGRNHISWEEKLKWDQQYIQRVSFMGDISIALRTISVLFEKQEVAERDGPPVTCDYGDWLLQSGQISVQEYEKKLAEAQKILGA